MSPRSLSDILSSEKTSSNETDHFFPNIPQTIEETGISKILIEDLICKFLLAHRSLTGKELSQKLGLPRTLIKDLLYDLKQKLILSHQSTSGIDDFVYGLTEEGRQKALLAREESNYLGTVPVPFHEYLSCIEKQSIDRERPRRQELEQAFEGLTLPDHYFDYIGPAVNSRRGMFLYGKPGNGKTEVATRIARCFTNTIYIPRTIIVEGTLIQLFDPQCHTPAEVTEEDKEYDKRWLKIERPAVVVGGEMDLDSLEIGFNEQTKTCEASLQLKGNNGIFVIDDFGRQRVGPDTLLNRWVLPLEKKIDYLTLPSGNKIRVPFNALLVFCSNLDPNEYLDEAFLRRIPYKIHMRNPSESEFLTIFKQESKHFDIRYEEETIEYLLNTHFRDKRPLRGCYPRDILQQLINMSVYSDQKAEMTRENLDRAVSLYFSLTEDDNESTS